MNPEASEQELNGFLARHKAVSIERKLIDQGVNSFWAICVDYLRLAPGDGVSNLSFSRSRVDYKAILPPEEFTVYSQLRDKRKELMRLGLATEGQSTTINPDIGSSSRSWLNSSPRCWERNGPRITTIGQTIDRSIRHLHHSRQLSAAQQRGDMAAQLELSLHVADTRLGMAKSPSEADLWRTVHAEVRELTEEAGYQWRGGRHVDPIQRPAPAMAKSFSPAQAAEYN